MNPEITKMIDQYLQGELSVNDQIAFEKKLAESDTLRNEVELQKIVYQGASRASVRTTVKQAGKFYHFIKKVQIAGITVFIATIIAFVSLLAVRYINKKKAFEWTEELITLAARLEKESPIDQLGSEFFLWNGADSILLSREGVLLSIPENAFLLDGKTYSGQAVIQWQEALHAPEIVKSGLSTMSGDRLLETQGMFAILAFSPAGKRLEMNPGIGIYVQVPVDEYKSGMQLFEGKKGVNGIIDWQNPKPLLKIPVPVDMASLDFYPPGYADSLDEMRLSTAKKYRDSLYLSFSESSSKVTEKELRSGEALFRRSCSVCHSIDKNATGPKLAGVRKKWFNGGAQTHSIYDFVRDWQVAAENDPYAAEVTMLKPTAMNVFPEYTNLQINNIFEYVDEQAHVKLNANERTKVNSMLQAEADSVYSRFCSCPHIDPAKVLAFWQPAFNNTNLATREFEKRMREIHGTCSEEVLEIYTQNLSSPISELDAKVAQMGYPEFEAFAAEQLGAVNPGNPHLKNLGKFYEKAIRQLQDEVHNNRDILKRRQQQWDHEMDAERASEKKRSVNRESKALDEEYKFNLKSVYKQLGKTVGFQIYGKSPIYNIDKYVMDATVSRTSATITDPENGKKAEITYNDFAFEIENPGQYQMIYAYLFPSRIQSYQRIEGQQGKFSYPLNNDMLYDLAVIGISEKGYAYFQQKTLNKGKLGRISLQDVSEIQLNASINQLNAGRMSSRIKVRDELNWLIRERKNYAEQKSRQDQAAFRERIYAILYKCSVEESICQ